MGMTKQFRYGNVCGDKGLVAPNNEWLIENVNSITDLEKNWDTVLDLLNELNNENTQLKKQLQDCRIYNGKLYSNGVKKDKPIVNDLIKQRKENTRIKQTIREAYETERTQIGRNVLKQLLEAIQ